MYQKISRNAIPAAVLVAAILFARPVQGQDQSPKSLGFKKQFTIVLTNPGPLTLENYPVILDVAAIRAVVPDFNSYNYAIFEETSRSVELVVSQADDLDKDRYHDEIVFIRTVLPPSTVKLTCYYSPTGSFQLMTSAKAMARMLGAPPAPGAPAPAPTPSTAALAWESNLGAFEFLGGRITPLGKLYAGLVVQKIRGGENKLQEWGMALVDPGESAGLGGLSRWEGTSRLPLMAYPEKGDLEIRTFILARGPLRSLAKVVFSGSGPGKVPFKITEYLSAYADNAFSRQDVIVDAKAPGVEACGPGFGKLGGEVVTSEAAKGFVCSWGQGAPGVGEAGLAAIFPTAAFAGQEDAGPDRWIKLGVKPGKRLTFWTLAGWERGPSAPGNPAAKNWARKVGELAAHLLTPVEIKYALK